MTAASLAVWWDEAADGPTNMATDERLAEEADRRGGPAIRFYGWSSPTVSLGGFQPLAEATACSAIAGLPLVRRPSGGGAIIHGSDLTYAAAVPKSHPWGARPQAFYDALHAAMVEVLATWGLEARLHVPSASDPPADAFLCFSRRAPGDLVAARPGQAPTPSDPKIMGSAQRRLGSTVIQHGSLLLGQCLAVGPEARHDGLTELSCAAATRPREIASRWIDRLAGGLGVDITPHGRPFAVGHEQEIARAAERFRDDRWTGRR